MMLIHGFSYITISVIYRSDTTASRGGRREAGGGMRGGGRGRGAGGRGQGAVKPNSKSIVDTVTEDPLLKGKSQYG
jgi:hypothetical protein